MSPRNLIQPILILLVFFLIGCGADSTDDPSPAELNTEIASAIASGDDAKVQKALRKVEERAEGDAVDPDTEGYRARALTHLGEHEKALEALRATQGSPHENRLLECILTEHVQGDAQTCYASILEYYRENHASEDEVHPDWVIAAIRSNHPSAESLTQTYLDQEKSKGKPEGKMANHLIKSVKDSTYFNQVLGKN